MVTSIFPYAVLVTVLSVSCTSLSHNPPQADSLATVLASVDEGATAFRQRDFLKAKDLYIKALEGARRVNNDAAIGGTLARLGATYDALQDDATALDLMFEALPFLQRNGDIPSQVQVHWAIGEVYLKTGRPQEALSELDQSIQLADVLVGQATREQEREINRSLAIIWGEKGLAHERVSQFTNSVEAYSTASSYFQKIGQSKDAGEALLQAGRIAATGLKNNAGSAKLFSDAERLFLEGEDRNSATRAALYQGEALFVEGETLRSKGDSVGLLGKFEAAREIFSKIGLSDVRSSQPEVRAEALWYLGRIDEGRAELQEAFAKYQSALKEVETLPDTSVSHLKPGLLISRGYLLKHLARYDEASADFMAGATVSKSVGNWEGEAFALEALADNSFWISDFQAAQQYVQEALALYKEHGKERSAILPQIRLLASLIELASVSGQVPSKAKATDELIVEYMKQGQSLLNEYEKPLTAKEIIGALYSARDSFHAEQYNQNLEEVLERDKAWLKGFPVQGPEFIQGYGEAEMLSSEIAFMESAWRQRFPALSADYFYTVGNFYQRIGISLLRFSNDPVRATLWLTNAALFHSSALSGGEGLKELGKDWYYLGEAYRQTHDTTRALINFYRVLVLGSTIKSPEVHWVYTGLGRTFADRGDLATAITFYTEGLAILDKVLKQSTIEATKSDVIAGALDAYRPLVSLLQDQYRHTQQTHYQHEAFRVNEVLRARGFLDLLSRSHAAALGGESQTAEKLKLGIADLQYRLRSERLGSAGHNVLVDRLQDLRNLWLEQQDAAAQRNPQDTQLWSSLPVNLLDVQRALDDDTALLEYMVQDDRLVMWMVANAQFEIHEQPLGDDEPILRKFMGTLRSPLLRKDEAAEHLALATSVYRSLIQPAETFIRGKKHLIIVPDGLLHYLPFEALAMPTLQDESEKSRGDLSGAQYLLKRYQISYAPSASVAMALRKGVRSRDAKPPFPLVAFGDPVYEAVSNAEQRSGVSQESWSRLEFSAEEVNRIAALWTLTSDSPHINLRERASKKRLREIDLSQYALLHFATHAFVPDKFSGSEQPALVLSTTAGDGMAKDGLLTFREILELKLKADLVVLSACKTNLGEFKWGEGLVGLSRAFFYAGASSLIVSFWDVQDQSTSLLMEDLYKRINQGERPAEALRQAKLALMNTRAELKATGREMSLESPFYWAPFVYLGPP